MMYTGSDIRDTPRRASAIIINLVQMQLTQQAFLTVSLNKPVTYYTCVLLHVMLITCLD